MIRRLLVCKSRSVDPYKNLALEEALLGRVGEGELILYLWQNERTVVIGKNQNPWKECRTALLEEEGGHLARRLSGGGAVFHDLGNLNFTFLMSSADYDLGRQMGVLEQACAAVGVPVERSGRNDLLAGGRKFSGNAFYKHDGKAYHHGTLMVNVDLELVQRYLSPSKAKLQAKGVESVRARVANLREFVPDLTVSALAEAMEASLRKVYSANRSDLPEVETLAPESFPLDVLRDKYRSDVWLYGQRLPFSVCLEERYSWGGIELRMNVDQGLIRTVQVYTDAMDETLSGKLVPALLGVALRPDALTSAIAQTNLSQRQKLDVLQLLQGAL